MQDVLVVVDMQNDFITGSLGTPEARAILPNVIEKVRGHTGPVLFTRDTHGPEYLSSQEGAFLPVIHCQKGTEGWQVTRELTALMALPPIDKPAFGSWELGERLMALNREEVVGSVTLVGLCTDICVISNALITKAALPEARVKVDAACCAGATVKGHQTALEALKPCQVIIENRTKS